MHAWEEEGGRIKVYRVNINAAFRLSEKKVLHRKYYYCNYIRDNFDCRIKHFLRKVNIIELV